MSAMGRGIGIGLERRVFASIDDRSSSHMAMMEKMPRKKLMRAATSQSCSNASKNPLLAQVNLLSGIDLFIFNHLVECMIWTSSDFKRLGCP